VAGTKTAKNRTSRNDTPNTPDVSESKIARMKVAELRQELDKRGVRGVAELKKPDLVKKMIKAVVAESRSAAKKTKAASSARSSSAGSSPASSASSARKSTASSARKSTSSAGGKSTSSSARKSTASAGGKSAGSASGSKSTASTGGKRTGKATSDSLKYSQEIRSTDDKPERPGRSLVTTDHDVIRQWAEARKAVPSTIGGSEHDGHLGVLRLDFPGYTGDRLTEVSWDDWFDAFDKRRLNFIYQQKTANGKRSNFFQLENPDE
jgi:hypothetical protein